MLRISDSQVSGRDDLVVNQDHFGSSVTRKTRLLSYKTDWNRHRETIIRLYWEENMPLRDVQDIMKREYGFDAS